MTYRIISASRMLRLPTSGITITGRVSLAVCFHASYDREDAVVTEADNTQKMCSFPRSSL